jgi:hypothetical protein
MCLKVIKVVAGFDLNIFSQQADTRLRIRSRNEGRDMCKSASASDNGNFRKFGVALEERADSPFADQARLRYPPGIGTSISKNAATSSNWK